MTREWRGVKVGMNRPFGWARRFVLDAVSAPRENGTDPCGKKENTGSRFWSEDLRADRPQGYVFRRGGAFKAACTSCSHVAVLSP